MQGSAGANSPLLHEHDNIHVPVNENQTEASVKSVIELLLDKENREQNNHLLLSCPNVPYDIPIEMPVPCEENKNGDIQQQMAQTQNDQGTLYGTPNYDSDYDDEEENPPDYYLEEQNAQPENNIGFQLGVNYFDRDTVTTPIQNHPNDKILACDIQRGWTRRFPDDMPLQGQFTTRQGLNIDMATKKPEDFFNLMFDDCMFKTIADETTNMQEIELHTLQMAEILLRKWMTLLAKGIIDCTNGKMSMC